MAKKATSMELAKLIKRYLHLRGMLTEVETALQVVKDQLHEAAVAGGGQAETSTHTVRVVESSRKTLSREKLLERGVAPAVIEFATTATKVSYIRLAHKNAKGVYCEPWLQARG